MTKKHPLEENVDLVRIAKETDRYSGADLVNLCNEVRGLFRVLILLLCKIQVGIS